MRAQLYLASRSPRRQQLLGQLGVGFEVIPVDVPEHPRPGQSPADYARAAALAKARAAGPRAAQALPILGADTDVVVDGEILGKPGSRAEALVMLARLSDRTHEVYSAVAVVGDGRAECDLSVSRVTFGPVAPAAAAAYWDSGEPAGKAGAYAIQGRGAAFVRSLEGSYSGVVGLPLYETCRLLERFGVAVPSAPRIPEAAHR